MLDQVIGGLVAGIPGCFVIDEHLDVGLAGGFADGEGVGQRHGERLFNHDGEVVFGAGFDRLAMAGDAGEDEQRLRLLRGDHAVDVGVEEAVIELVFCFVGRVEGGVGIDDGDELDFGMVGQVVEEAGDVAVFETNYGDADWGLGMKVRFEPIGR